MKTLYHNSDRYEDELFQRLCERFLDWIYEQPFVIIHADGRVLFDWNPIDEWSLAQLQAELTRARLCVAP